MTGTVELSADGSRLVIRFDYREDLVAAARSLPTRRWDKPNKSWLAPATDVAQVYATFSRFLFEFAPEVTGLLAGTRGTPSTAPSVAPLTADAASAASAMSTDIANDVVLPFTAPDQATTLPGADAEPTSLSVSQLNEHVRAALHEHFPQRVWVTGEVSDFDKQQDRQHKFFTLVEKSAEKARPRARVEAALFERTAAHLLPRLQAAAADFTLRDGIEIRVLVRIDLWVPSGRFQVVVEDIDPAFTLGKLALSREQILRELRERGLADRNRVLPLPTLPLRVGVLASPDSDGWNDFVRHLQESGRGFDVTLVPVKVQGHLTRPSMLLGLHWFAAHASEFDVLCILRGGGSRTDLAWFDDLEIAVAVAQLPLKVLVGIGHQRDQSVLDVIAHSEKTPTAVAERLVATVTTAARAVAGHAVRLQAGVGRMLTQAKAALADAAAWLQRGVATRLLHERMRLRTAARDLDVRSQRRCADDRQHLGTAARALQSQASLRCERARSALLRLADRNGAAATRRLERAHGQLDQQAARHRLLDPAAVLRRGYAIVRAADGHVLPSADRVTAGQRLDVQLRDGTLHVRTEAILRP